MRIHAAWKKVLATLTSEANRHNSKVPSYAAIPTAVDDDDIAMQQASATDLIDWGQDFEDRVTNNPTGALGSAIAEYLHERGDLPHGPFKGTTVPQDTIGAALTAAKDVVGDLQEDQHDWKIRLRVDLEWFAKYPKGDFDRAAAEAYWAHAIAAITLSTALGIHVSELTFPAYRGDGGVTPEQSLAFAMSYLGIEANDGSTRSLTASFPG